MKKNTGSALIDYIIPTALIGLVCGASLYYMLSDNKILNFAVASSDMEVKVADQMGIMGYRKSDENAVLNNLVGGSFGGTPDNPVEKCTDGTCTIDYGEFILTGVPEDFSDLVQNTGASGGTDKLVSFVQQLANQLEQDGKMNESSEVKKLASIGHNIAILEKEYEKIVNGCNRDAACVSNYANQIIPKPAGFDETFYPFVQGTYKTLAEQVPIGASRRWQIFTNEGRDFNDLLARNYSAPLFVNKYQSLMNETNLSGTQKGVIKELYWQIAKLSEDVEAGIALVSPGGYVRDYSDPFTGLNTDNPDLPDDPFDIYSGYKPSSMSHVDSALICAAGYNTDTGVKCH